MPKLKKEPSINENKKNLFFYEILGIILALLSFFALAKLGTFGFYLSLTVKLFFGDWSFLFTILGILCGGYFVLMHQRLPISSLRFLGIVLIFISMSILSHFSMHDYVKQYTTSYLSTSLNLYFDYFKSGNSDSMVGGGLFGMAFFYILYYLISTPGVIIISIGMIILGISFISRKTLVEFSKFFLKVFKKLLVYMRSRGSKLKDFLEKVNNEFNTIGRKKLPKNLMIPVEEQKTNISNKALELTNQIKVVLNRLNLFHYEVNHYITPHLIVFEIKSHLSVNINQFERQLVRDLGIPFLIKINEDDNVIMVEITNPMIRKVSLYEANNYMQDSALFITIDDHNSIISLDSKNKYLLLICKNNDSFLFYIILSLMQKQNEVILIDLGSELFFMKKYVNNYQENIDYFDQLIVDIENSVNNVPIYCFINLDVTDQSLETIISKLRYIIQLATPLNYFFIVRINGYVDTQLYFYDLFNYVYTIDIDKCNVLRLFGFERSDGLVIGSEGLIKNEDIVMRVANVYLNEKEKAKLADEEKM